tara:strand:+ start:1820 stop:2002 length:183 start_codon:yes stop_codon:yes gene_type:complete
MKIACFITSDYSDILIPKVSKFDLGVSAEFLLMGKYLTIEGVKLWGLNDPAPRGTLATSA